MFDDFWAGMNYGQSPRQQTSNTGYATSQRNVQGRVVQVRKPIEYDKRPQIYMIDQYGNIAELWANGKVYIKKTDNSVEKMTFPSRPFAIRKLMARGYRERQ